MEVLLLVSCVLLLVFAALFLVPLCILVYLKLANVVCQSSRLLTGKTAIITGANSGIGLETARDLAARNARVILACRSLTRGQEAARDITRTTGNADVVVKLLDLSSLESVREFAKDILENEARLDVLVNNAGAIYRDHPVSADGIELTMMVNYFGPFLLTNLLLPLLKKSAPARIVVVSTAAYRFGETNFEDASWRKLFPGFFLYFKSKLASVVFTLELAKRLQGSKVTVNCLSPGMVRTEIAKMYPSLIALDPLLGRFVLTPAEGAQTSIFLSVSQEVESVSGKYFRNCKEASLHRKALNPQVAKQLWDYSVRMTGLVEQ